jgi:succinate-semialdehyde dehydrogenase/glutarate-semialdehyde dehydrogenase
MTIIAINPTTGETIREYQPLSVKAAKAAVKAAEEAFQSWRQTAFPERAKSMRKAARVLRDNAAGYARLMAQEMGKPLAGGKAEVEKCAWACEYYAEHAERFLERQYVETDASKSYVSFQPLGVVFAIMPWNFPFWQVFRFAAPNLMAGNAAILKHAPNVPGCALALAEVFERAGFPEHVFQSLLLETDHAKDVIKHPLVRAVTLTGSVRAGKAVAKQAGALLKKTVLELGGSDPYVVLADADIDHAVETSVTSRLLNSGQSCIAAKRFIVVEQQREAFQRAVVERMRAVRMGDPMDSRTEIGPQARQDLRDTLHAQVTKSVGKGARVLLGGEVPDRAGWFYPPTVLTDVRKGMPAYSDELFGPVAAIITVKHEQQALNVANDTGYGLGAAIFTRDSEKGERFAERELEAGSCFVNALVRSDPRLPFGGIKESGYGRELGVFGIWEFVNVKTVWVR